MNETMILISLCFAVVCVTAIIGMILLAQMVYRTTEDSKSLIEQAFNHFNSPSAIEATNATSTQEFNRKLIDIELGSKGDPPETPPEKVRDSNVYTDKVTGKEYDILGGPDGFIQS